MTDELIERLVAAGREFDEAKREVKKLCALVAAGDDLEKTCQREVRVETPKRIPRGGRRKSVAKKPGAVVTKGEAKVTYHPEEIVGCTRCGAKVACRRVGTVPYPYRHPDESTGQPCPGYKQPAKILTES
jgi:hypothetical protein